MRYIYLAFIVIAAPLICSQQVFVGNNSASDSVSVVNTQTNEVVATISLQGNRGPQSVTFSPDGSLVFVCCKTSNTVVVLNAETNSYVTAIPIQGAFPYFTAFTPDGSKAYVTCFNSHSVSVIDVASLTVSAVITANIGTSPFFPVATWDGAKIYVTNGNSSHVSVINTATNTAQLIPVSSTCEYATLSPDGTKLYVALDPPANSVAVIDTATNNIIANIPTFATQPVFVVVTPDGNTGYVSNYSSHCISVLNLKNNAFSEIISTNIGSEPNIGAITPDGSKVYFTNSQSNNISVINTTTNTAQLITTGTISGPFWIAAAPEGTGAYFTNFKATSTNITEINTQTQIGTSITVGTEPYFLAITPIPICKSVKGKTKKNKFLTQTDLVNEITWTPAGFNPTHYNIYRDVALKQFIGSVSSSKPLVFYDHGCVQGKTYSYYIVSVNQAGAGTTRVGKVAVTSR